MEQYDAEMAKRVWQRVNGTAPQADPAMLYGQVARLAKTLEQLQYKTLAEEFHRDAACLRGLCRILSLRQPQGASQPYAAATRQARERRCYAAMLELLNAYGQMESHPQLGPVMQELGQRTRNACRSLAEMAGK